MNSNGLMHFFVKNMKKFYGEMIKKQTNLLWNVNCVHEQYQMGNCKIISNVTCHFVVHKSAAALNITHFWCYLHWKQYDWECFIRINQLSVGPLDGNDGVNAGSLCQL